MCDRARVVKAGRNQNASLPESEVLERMGHKGWGLSLVSRGPYGSTRFPIRLSKQPEEEGPVCLLSVRCVSAWTATLALSADTLSPL